MKLAKILNCKNSLLFGLLFVVTIFPILMIMTNAHAEVLTLKNENNLSIFENANNKTSITTSNTAIENNLDNKTISQQEILELEQIDDDKVGTDNSSVSSGNTSQTKELALTESDGSSSHGTVTIEAQKIQIFNLLL